MAVSPNLVPASVTAVSTLATATAGAPWWGVVICLVLVLAATSVQTLFPQDSPDRLIWWTNHREHRRLRRAHDHDRRGLRPGPPA
ncbi:hypothetical protein OG892_39775 [Streptomyces sp. NBC_00341]|uniref:hypothetical protein n=1 Tax=Streptomyces sp. NBC_00341 TaxID=2975717 RepID=UPI0030870A63|nr:hypothetical protein OG892_39775 [Streptomyces sp. NBC_00341]